MTITKEQLIEHWYKVGVGDVVDECESYILCDGSVPDEREMAEVVIFLYERLIESITRK